MSTFFTFTMLQNIQIPVFYNIYKKIVYFSSRNDDFMFILPVTYNTNPI